MAIFFELDIKRNERSFRFILQKTGRQDFFTENRILRLISGGLVNDLDYLALIQIYFIFALTLCRIVNKFGLRAGFTVFALKQ